MATLFLKYRPQNFDDVVGQTPIIKTLKNAIKNEKASHAYLFCGSRGTGKTSIARIVAKAMNCPNQKEGNPCNDCNICKDITTGSCVDVIEIDAASNRGINEIREIRDKISFAPSVAGKKVYIVDEVHMLTKEAFNALLKTLEEPPEHAYFVLATTELHKVPETIISRCQTFLFQMFTIDQLVDRLKSICEKEGITADSESLNIIARKAEGGLRDGISILEQTAAENENELTKEKVEASLGLSSTQTLESFQKAVEENDTNAGLKIIKDLAQKGHDFRSFGHDLLIYLRGILHQQVQDNQNPQTTLNTIEVLQKALSQLKSSPIVELPFEMAVIQLTSGNANYTKPPSPVQKEAPVPKPAQPTAPVAEKSPPAPASEKEPTPEPAAPKKEDSGFGLKEEKPIDKNQTVESAAKITLTTSVLKERMKHIADKSDIPTLVKRSFLACEPSINDGKITFTITSEFHYEKLKAATVQTQIKKSLSETFNEVVPIEFKLNKTVATTDDFNDFFSE
ncbi:UNVERIFIED_CONTAM: hypothetical protein GTU68_035847 [Idotea baltica]|nr:hypothetical protein [Idotea baltica]